MASLARATFLIFYRNVRRSSALPLHPVEGHRINGASDVSFCGVPCVPSFEGTFFFFFFFLIGGSHENVFES